MNPLKFELTGNDNLDILLTKINNGADVDIKNERGDTALILALYSRYTNIAKLLVENRANVNKQDNDKWTPLMYASNLGNIEMCNLLIDSGAEINIPNIYFSTALILASDSGYIETCKLLIEKGANLNAQDIHGNTALILASTSGYTDICKLLLENGADIDIEDDYGNTAIDIMKNKGIYKEVEPYKILGLKYFREVFKEYSEDYIDIFNTTLYSENVELDDIKANIDMFHSNVVAKIADNTINESLEL